MCSGWENLTDVVIPPENTKKKEIKNVRQLTYAMGEDKQIPTATQW